MTETPTTPAVTKPKPSPTHAVTVAATDAALAQRVDAIAAALNLPGSNSGMFPNTTMLQIVQMPDAEGKTIAERYDYALRTRADKATNEQKVIDAAEKAIADADKALTDAVAKAQADHDATVRTQTQTRDTARANLPRPTVLGDDESVVNDATITAALTAWKQYHDSLTTTASTTGAGQ